MITTVITSAMSSVTTAGFGAMMGLVAFVALVSLLCVREMAAVNATGKRGFLARFLDISIIPLLIVFAMILVLEIVKIAI